MSCTSARAAKSRCLRQTNGAISASSASPALAVAGAGPRLDHGRAFPGPPFPLVIMQRRFDRDRHRRRGRIRPQPQVDAEHVAVAVALLQKPRQALRDAHEERLRLDIRRQRRRGRIEEHDQVDVAGIIQLARAHLAHREHDQAAIVLGRIGVGRRQPPACGLLPQHKAQRRLHRGDRKIGQRRGDLHHRPDAADVARAQSAARLPISCGAAAASRRLRWPRPTPRGRSFRSVRPDAAPVRIRAAGPARAPSARTRSKR